MTDEHWDPLISSSFQWGASEPPVTFNTLMSGAHLKKEEPNDEQLLH